MLDPTMRAAIEARLAAATPLPWTYFGEDLWQGVTVEQLAAYEADPNSGDHELPIDCGALFYGDPYRKEDAEFIAHVRTDIPTLLAEIDRLTAIVEGAGL